MPYARRTDGNLIEIVDAYRELGCTVHVENGVVDLKIGYAGITELVEVKNGKLSPSRRKLTPAQVVFRKTWTGGIRLITSLSDVGIHVRQMRELHRFICEMRLSPEELRK